MISDYCCVWRPERLHTFQTEEEEGVVSFDVVPALQPAVGDEDARSCAGASVVSAAVGLGHFRAHLAGIVPVELSTWKKNQTDEWRLTDINSRTSGQWSLNSKLTIRRHLVRFSGDHPVHVHLLSDVRLLIHQGHRRHLPRTRPFELVVVGAWGQVEVGGHVPGAVASSI